MNAIQNAMLNVRLEGTMFSSEGDAYRAGNLVFKTLGLPESFTHMAYTTPVSEWFAWLSRTEYKTLLLEWDHDIGTEIPSVFQP